ncbi:MAG: SDR family NAD(P)-dependent oxidoreductase [Verrucomicrobia bacterium]|nr:SDR family NAD(P)-dependent oxidoreductase [Verrucomicrobiota bacterium]
MKSKAIPISAMLILGATLLYKGLRPQASFAGQVVVITGGSRGLGFALARNLARQNADLALIARDESELAKARSELTGYGSIVTTWPCDIFDESALRATIDQIGKRFGVIDMLINNAGEILVGPFDAMNRHDFISAMNIHFWAPLTAITTVLPYLRKTANPRIINISSIGGRIAVPHLGPYCASKFALTGLSDVLRAELASKKIAVTTVTPGLMRTGSHQNALFKGAHRQEFSWFSLSAGAPLISMGADRAARKILQAALKKRPVLTLTLTARALILVQAVFPNYLGRIMKLVARLLPNMPSHGGTDPHTGWESHSRISPSVLTVLADRAVDQFNERR